VNPEYAKIFDKRGNLYDAAMRFAPDARRREFENLMTANPVHDGAVVVDIPAGGGYLKQFLPRDISYYPLEITAAFGAQDVAVVAWNEAWRTPPADHVFCVAALHHFEDHEAALARLLDAAKPGGVVHVADVWAGSPISHFLDDFVGAHNGTGHDGNYLSDDRGRLPFPNKLLRCEVISCPWRFADRADMVGFARLLFAVSDLGDDEIFDALERYVGVSETPDGVALNWSLLYADYQA
jgi:SAM-dependent methyltransferase